MFNVEQISERTPVIPVVQTAANIERHVIITNSVKMFRPTDSAPEIERLGLVPGGGTSACLAEMASEQTRLMSVLK